jgi:hypothetical protein
VLVLHAQEELMPNEIGDRLPARARESGVRR